MKTHTEEQSKWYEVKYNPDYSVTISEKRPITCHCKSELFSDVTKAFWERSDPRDGIAPLSYMQLKCENGHTKTLRRNSVRVIE